MRGGDHFRGHLAAEVTRAIFDRAGRDFESIGLGVVFPRLGDKFLPGLRQSISSEVLASAVRILGLAQQFEGSTRTPVDEMPAPLRDYLQAVAERYSASAEELIAGVEDLLRSAEVINNRFQLATGSAGAPFAIRLIESGTTVLRCGNCARVHTNPVRGGLHESHVPFDPAGSHRR